MLMLMTTTERTTAMTVRLSIIASGLPQHAGSQNKLTELPAALRAGKGTGI
jgi:hypothetical protein